MGRLTTHVLDTARGRPAAGLTVELYRLELDRQRVMAAATNADGRLDAPALEGAAFQPGQYEFVFFAGDYLRQTGAVVEGALFLDHIPIRFTLFEDAHFHVPLLLSPFGYSTYRGS